MTGTDLRKGSGEGEHGANDGETLSRRWRQHKNPMRGVWFWLAGLPQLSRVGNEVIATETGLAWATESSDLMPIPSPFEWIFSMMWWDTTQRCVCGGAVGVWLRYGKIQYA